MEEIWKEIEGYKGYFASTLGRIKSPTGKILTGGITKDGYINMTLKKEGKWICKKIARIIAETFIPNPENKPCIDHINTIRTDNRIENLKWVTYKENMHNPITYNKIISEVMKPERLKNLDSTGKHFSEEHKRKIGLSNNGNKGCGWRRKSVICIETGNIYESMMDAEKEMKIHSSSIGKVCLGERKTAGGYHWKYI